MSKTLADWLLRQIGADQKTLNQDRKRRSTLQNKNWDHRTLLIEGVVYRQLDVEREEAEIDAKKKIVDEYRKLLAIPNRQQAEGHSQTVESWEQVVKCLATPYAGRLGYKSISRP